MSLIRESLKKVQEDHQNDKTTATLISGPKANGGKKITTSTYMLVGIGVVLIAGAYLFLYRPGPTKSAAPGGAAAPKPVVLAQASSPVTPAQSGPSSSLTSHPEPTLKTETKPTLKRPASATGPLSGSMAPPSSQGKPSKDPLKEKVVEASVLGPRPTAAKKKGQGKAGLPKLTVQRKEKTGKGLRTKGLAREVPAVARMGAGEPQDRGGQEALKQSYQQAYSWQQEGKTEQAVSRYREILRQDPYNPYVLTNLGLIYQQTGNLKEAISLYEKALEADPKFVPAAQNLGVAWLKAGNSEEAARWLEKTLDLQPDNANALVNLGLLYKRRGNREMARQSLRKAWTINNRLPEASYNLARLEEEAGNIPEAYKYYQQFIRTRNDPNDNLVREVQRHIQNWGIPEPVQK
jgi:Flp pilus assembly protein TadD